MLSLLAAYMPPLRIAYEGAAAPSCFPGAILSFCKKSYRLTEVIRQEGWWSDALLGKKAAG